MPRIVSIPPPCSTSRCSHPSGSSLFSLMVQLPGANAPHHCPQPGPLSWAPLTCIWQPRAQLLRGGQGWSLGHTGSHPSLHRPSWYVPRLCCIFSRCPSRPSYVPPRRGAQSLMPRESSSLSGRKSSSGAAPCPAETGWQSHRGWGGLERLLHLVQAGWPWANPFYSLTSVSLPVDRDTPPTSL